MTSHDSVPTPQQCREGIKASQALCPGLRSPKELAESLQTNTCISTRLNFRRAAPRVSFLRMLWLEGGWMRAATALLCSELELELCSVL